MFPEQTSTVSALQDLHTVDLDRPSNYVQEFSAAFIPFILKMIHFQMTYHRVGSDRPLIVANFQRTLKAALKRNPLKGFFWRKLVQKLQKEINNKNYSDQRLCFKFNTFYLVKYGFTFGYQTVAPNEVHIIQTKSVPILYYRLKADYSGRKQQLGMRNGFFSHMHFHRFDQYILYQDKTFAIKPNTTYLILTPQKCIFSCFKIKSEDLDELKKKFWGSDNKKKDFDNELQYRHATSHGKPVYTCDEDNEAMDGLMFPPNPYYESTIMYRNYELATATAAATGSVDVPHQLLVPVEAAASTVYQNYHQLPVPVEEYEPTENYHQLLVPVPAVQQYENVSPFSSATTVYQNYQLLPAAAPEYENVSPFSSANSELEPVYQNYQLELEPVQQNYQLPAAAAEEYESVSPFSSANSELEPVQHDPANSDFISEPSTSSQSNVPPQHDFISDLSFFDEFPWSPPKNDSIIEFSPATPFVDTTTTTTSYDHQSYEDIIKELDSYLQQK